MHTKSNHPQKKKPRTYREIARKAYLSLVKLRRPSNRKRRAGIRQQLQFLQRNLNHIEAMLTEYPPGTPIYHYPIGYCAATGYYPICTGNNMRCTRDNRSYLECKHIRFSGKPLGRPSKSTPENKDEIKRLKAQRRQEYRERIPIEGKFGQGKYGYRLNHIRAKRADTSRMD